MAARRLAFVVVVIAVLVSGCDLRPEFGRAPVTVTGKEPDAQNGARIYYTAASGRGSAIAYTGGPSFSGAMMGMMGNNLTCASCHGPEGRGGIHTMHMSVMKAPDIRYAALSTMPEMRQRSRPYGLDDFRAAVIAGKHPDGEATAADMPRWRMSDADLQDLYAFVERLPQ